MSIRANTTAVKGVISATDSKAVAGFDTATHAPEVSFTAAPNTTTYNYAQVAYGTLNSNANVTVDLYSFTSALGESVTATKLAGFAVKALPSNTSNLGGQLLVGQAAANTATLFMGGTTPYVQLPVNTSGAFVMLMSGSHETLNTTVRNLFISNPGSNAIAYTVFALEGS